MSTVTFCLCTIQNYFLFHVDVIHLRFEKNLHFCNPNLSQNCEFKIHVKQRMIPVTGSKNHDVDFPMSVSTEPITLNEDTPNEVQVRVITDVRGNTDLILTHPVGRSRNFDSS